jgi:hypothetical protein
MIRQGVTRLARGYLVPSLGRPVMVMDEAKETAIALIQRHGMRAQAVAQEHAAEKQTSGDAEAAVHWRQIGLAIAELRAARGVN